LPVIKKGNGMKYHITNITTGDYWNNELGWTEFKSLADIYNNNCHDLPLDGAWVLA
jgi:hypothetical protein